ncbi:MAG TPA: hypothetical protein VGG39_04955 [Polyangiaceae bacterium]
MVDRQYEGSSVQAPEPRLRRTNRTRTILGSVAIRGTKATARYRFG